VSDQRPRSQEVTPWKVEAPSKGMDPRAPHTEIGPNEGLELLEGAGPEQHDLNDRLQAVEGTKRGSIEML